MDVTCERCSTEYEFDDALVSERGTTVKCTNCGYQFKVRRTDGVTAPERWVVRTVDGREMEFTALRELQAAIAHARVTKDDVLSRGATRPRRLGSIAELEPFFANAGGSTAPGLGGGRSRVPTPSGLGDPGVPRTTEGSVAIPLPAPLREPPRPVPREISPIAVPTPRPPSYDPKLPPLPVPPPSDAEPTPIRLPDRPDLAATVPSPQTPLYAGAAADLAPQRTAPDEPPTLPRAVRVPADMEDGEARAAYPPDPSDMLERTQGSEGNAVRRPFDPSAELARGHEPPPPATPTPTDVRSSYEPRASYYEGGRYTEPRFSSIAPSRQSGHIRWIGGFVVLGMLVFLGLTVGRKYLAAGQQQAPASAAPSATGSPDERIGKYLRDGETALGEGDLEGAKESFDKASALAENDPRVGLLGARLAMVRAEVPWLRVKLLADDDPLLPSAKKELETATERAKKAAARAAELSPTDPNVTRYRIDALRLSGDREGARKLVPALGAQSSQPDNALVLAALDLAEEKPDWASVLERLRAASRSEQKLGRARALLVYALARSGAAADAKTELDRLAALPRSHPLIPTLTAFLQRADKDGKVHDVGSLPDASKRPPDGPAAGTARPAEPAGDPKAAGKKPPRGDGRVPDDYVWPGYGDDKPAPTAQPTTPPQPKPDTADLPGAKPGAKP